MSLIYSPNNPGVLADPFPLYVRMRDEDPAHWSSSLKAWVLTRYDDVKRVCLDPGMSSDRLRPFFATLPSGEAGRNTGAVRVPTPGIVFRGPPQPTRLRRLTAKVFHVRPLHAPRPHRDALTPRLPQRLAHP